jgi:aminopeptidase-like protein
MNNMPTFLENLDLTLAGEQMHAWMAKLYPICRSITGEGFRETLRRLQQLIPLELHEVPTGTPVFDWTVPQEWNIRDAYVKNARGEKVIDFQTHSLHILNYSIPFRGKLSLDELKPHLFSLPEYPDWIPYRTSYYAPNWGFCLRHRDFLALEPGEYEVVIDSTVEDGHLTYGEYFLPGETTGEVLISCHSCHPSLCNDNLSGVMIATFLAQQLFIRPHRLSYRFLFIPGTIGSITWLALNEEKTKNIRHGLVIATAGDSGHMHYKKSRRGDAEIDQAVIHVLKQSAVPFEVEEFSPYGYDERQYCSPGFNLPVGNLGRTPHGRFPEYHTSADNLEFVRPEYLADTFAKFLTVFEVLEGNRKYLNKNPKGEPQLGRRGLYGTFGGRKDAKTSEMAMLWVLNYSDGDHTLLDIAEKANLEFKYVRTAANALMKADLLEEVM